ncbi:fumarylacetoacetate hydrolase family protein [Pseudenhygromyxa sp. WMMC2535]|uniref:fumarylacetoacetate hydrolase family protein n=1 Tax=Pseudenhygromyxa sp. WMMC2535 TaxID=2712867 RepID=UPI0015557A09|nr:fumarylacetoacetate hydrolase family protein [Pseudenhygromyxa sp. WMMC2535]NVB37596.1 fumarylacetoacetate hydrolase family protein [Pseudenhygromyxa sp. WMMC2535]
MRLASLCQNGRDFLAAHHDGQIRDLSAVDATLGADLGALIASGEDWYQRAQAAVGRAPAAEPGASYRPVVPRPPKFMCLGLNDVVHAREAKLPIPEFPVVFSRVASSLIGHGQAMLRPAESEALDFEVELAVIIGRGGRRIPEAEALDHVAGYSVFNDGSIRDWQLRDSQWTLGKNFHGTGALGPWMVTPEELPPGASGLRMTTRVGDELFQDGDTGKMIFGVARTIALLSAALAFEPGDVIAMGTPAGIGHARTPPRYLRPGETCTVAIEAIGELANPIADDPPR